MENQESIYEEKQGNLLTGILGALLGALIGTALKISSVASRHARDFLSFFFIFLLPFKDFSI